MKRITVFLLLLLVLLSGCRWKSKSLFSPDDEGMPIGRLDRLEIRYLSTGDRAAWQAMQMEYPQQTRRLVEELLHLGQLSDEQVHGKLLGLFADSVPQTVLAEVDRQYADVSDLEKHFDLSFRRLLRDFPELEMPEVYFQIGLFNESIVVNGKQLGVSLDKYLGADFAPYAAFFSPQQCNTMTRYYIIPDCISFYLLSHYPLPDADRRDEVVRHRYMARIMWLANRAMRQEFFSNAEVKAVDDYMQQHPNLSGEDLLREVPLTSIKSVSLHSVSMQ